MTAPQPLIAGNWKMNGLSASLAEARAVAAGLGDTPARVAICPPSILIHRLAEALKGTTVLVGGQDHHWDDAGAFTGDISAEIWNSGRPARPWPWSRDRSAARSRPN